MRKSCVPYTALGNSFSFSLRCVYQGYEARADSWSLSGHLLLSLLAACRNSSSSPSPGRLLGLRGYAGVSKISALTAYQKGLSHWCESVSLYFWLSQSDMLMPFMYTLPLCMNSCWKVKFQGKKVNKYVARKHKPWVAKYTFDCLVI